MPLSAWLQRPEQLGMFVGVRPPELTHEYLGDAWHRAAVRDAGTALVIRVSASAPWRSVLAHMAIGGRVACFAQERDDAFMGVRRILHVGHAYVACIPLAVHEQGTWWSGELHEWRLV